MSEPLIVGIRHHSPACARLVKLLIESQRPRYVLIEGPADFNDRVDELFLAHQLPVAIYSYCQYQDGAAPGRGTWTPFAEFSPEWQALQAARRIQAQTYFIDLPCWAQSEEEDESPDTQDDSQTLLLRATRMDNSDTLWDHLFEDESQQTALPSALARYFAQLRGDSPGDALNRQREAFMARWITWAMQQNNGDVLVVCGGSLTGATQSGDSCPGAGSRRDSWCADASGTSQRQCRSGADDAGAVIPDTIRRGAARFAGISPSSTGLSAGIYRRFQQSFKSTE